MNNKALIAKNQERWDQATFKAAASKQAASVAKNLVAAKDIYLKISVKTGVPWYVIAVIHQRESGQRWDRSIAQGDRFDRPSIHVPKGRGPFSSFEEAAVDALVDCAPYASKWTDWSAGGCLTLLELYNGLGYANKGLPSPYIWSGTNQYKSGKYVSDGVFDPNVVDTQLGCAVILDCMHAIDESIDFDNASEMKTPKVNPTITQEEADAIEAPKAGPTGDATDAKPAVQSTTVWASIMGIVTALGAGVTDVIQKAEADWKILALLIVAGLLGYILWKRSSKEDIKGIIS